MACLNVTFVALRYAGRPYFTRAAPAVWNPCRILNGNGNHGARRVNAKAMVKSTNLAAGLLRKLYRAFLLPAFAALLLAAMWAAVVYQVGQERSAAHDEAVLRSHAQARTLAENASFLLRQADHATQLFKLKFEETEGALRLAEFTRHNGLLDSLMPAQLQLPLALYDRHGRLVDSRHGWFAPQAAGTKWFAALAAAPGDMPHFANPLVDPVTKKWQIQVARRLDDGHGRLAGAVVLLVDPAYFVEDYDRLHLAPGGMAILQSRDTGLATGRVDDNLFIGDAIPFMPAPPPQRMEEEAALRRPFDGVPRIYAFREMPRYGLVAVVGDRLDHALGRFEYRRRLYYGAVAAASLAVLLFTALMLRQARRLRNSTRAANAAQRQLRAAADASLDALFLLKVCHACSADYPDFILADVNERGAAFLGHPRGRLLGQRIGALMPSWRAEGFFDKYRSVLDTGRPLEEEFETRSGAGAPVRWLQHQIVAIDDGVAVTTRDITARKHAELAIRQNQAELAAVNDASPLGMIRTDGQGRCTYVNRAFETITGRTRAELPGHAWLAAVHPNDRAILRTALEQLRRTRAPFQDAVRCVRPDGTVVWLSVQIAPVLVDGRIEGFVGTLDDITLVRKSMVALRENEARLRTIADTMPAMIAYLDMDEVYRFQNRTYEREFTRLGMQAIGRSSRDIVGERRYELLLPYIRRALAGETVAFDEDEEPGMAPDGAPRSFEVRYIPQFDDSGASVIGFHVVRNDVTATRRELQHLLKLAQIDALTGLTNRAGFLQKLGDGMQSCREHGTMMAVMYMDIDHFKPVNDTYGHSVGDALLKAFSGRLTHALRATDTVARLGGDEFTIIMENIGRHDDAQNAAAKIVAAMQAPFDLDGVQVRISTSIGVTFYRDAELAPAELLKRADVLLYEAKQAGRNTFRVGGALAALRPDAA